VKPSVADAKTRRLSSTRRRGTFSALGLAGAGAGGLPSKNDATVGLVSAGGGGAAGFGGGRFTGVPSKKDARCLPLAFSSAAETWAKRPPKSSSASRHPALSPPPRRSSSSAGRASPGARDGSTSSPCVALEPRTA
jgi:hypothetical protein